MAGIAAVLAGPDGGRLRAGDKSSIRDGSGVEECAVLTVDGGALLSRCTVRPGHHFEAGDKIISIRDGSGPGNPGVEECAVVLTVDGGAEIIGPRPAKCRQLR